MLRSSLTRCAPRSVRASFLAHPVSICRHYSAETYSITQSDQQKELTDLAIEQRARDPQRPIQLHRLVRFNPTGPSREQELLSNAKEVIDDITVRLARRLSAMRSLPYIVMLNPYVARIYNIYYNSFRVLGSLSPPTSMEENDKFVELLESLVNAHSNTIPTLAKGFSESRKFMDGEDFNEILENHLVARIGTRLLAENHISLTHPIGPNYIGSIQTDLCPADVVRTCAHVVGDLCSVEYGVVPEVEIDQGAEVKLAYVPVHLEYIFTELLKNAFRAVAENGTADTPITVTVIPTGQGVIIRFRDRGGGMSPAVEKDIFNFSFTTFKGSEDEHNDAVGLEVTGRSSIAGLGYGLPLSRAYAEFFGGKLQLQSYFGWGTDVYLTLKSPMISGFNKEAV